VRLSTGTDLRLSASMADTIGLLKKQLQAQEDIDAAHQRWFFSGKLLTDKTRLQDTKIQKDFVIQVIVNPLALQPKLSPATTPTAGAATTTTTTTPDAITPAATAASSPASE